MSITLSNFVGFSPFSYKNEKKFMARHHRKVKVKKKQKKKTSKWCEKTYKDSEYPKCFE